MDWDEMVKERAQARRKRISLLSAMLAADFAGALGFALAFVGFLDWLIAGPIMVLGWGTGCYIAWRIFFGNRVGSGENTI